MPLCAFGDPRLRSDHTQVENAFIRDYMPSAPDGYVKVYLFGLMQCQSGVGPSSLLSFANALHMSEEQVRCAFTYWSQAGLVRMQQTPRLSILYQSARHAMPAGTSTGAQELYTHKELNEQLSRLFSPQLLTPAELRKIYDWMDVFGLAPQSVLLLIRYGRSKLQDLSHATISRQLSYIETIARQWADEGIRAPEQAEQWLMQQEQHQSGLTVLLHRLGLRRSPTAAERKLYQGWLNSGFTQEAILLAADRTISSRNPSLDTVGNILASLQKAGARTADDVRAENSEQLCREALTALGLRQPTPTASQLDTYRAWRSIGHLHEHILLACEICCENGRRNMRDVAQTLHRWQQRNLREIKAIRAFEASRKASVQALEEVFSRMGLPERKAQDADIAQYELWNHTWNLSQEVILFGAETAHGAASPYRLLKKLMEQWHDAGVQSVAQARALERQPRYPSATQNPALRYTQRPIDPQQDDGIQWF